jgi:hypothetical protein
MAVPPQLAPGTTLGRYVITSDRPGRNPLPFASHPSSDDATFQSGDGALGVPRCIGQSFDKARGFNVHFVRRVTQPAKAFQSARMVGRLGHAGVEASWK